MPSPPPTSPAPDGNRPTFMSVFASIPTSLKKTSILPLPRALPYTINATTMWLYGAHHPSPTRLNRGWLVPSRSRESRSHQPSAGAGSRDGLRRKAHSEPLPSLTDSKAPRAFHLGPARKAQPPSPLTVARSRPGVTPLQSRPPWLAAASAMSAAINCPPSPWRAPLGSWSNMGCHPGCDGL